MKKNVLVIIGIIVGIAIILGVALVLSFNNNSRTTGAFKKTNFDINGYTITIASKEYGHPSENSYWGTSFNIVDSSNYKRTYTVDFVDLQLTQSTSTDVIYDVAPPEIVEINGKTFECYINEADCNATLYYFLPNKKGRLVIKVYGNAMFDDKGASIKAMPQVDTTVLRSSEFASILNFSIHK